MTSRFISVGRPDQDAAQLALVHDGQRPDFDDDLDEDEGDDHPTLVSCLPDRGVGGGGGLLDLHRIPSLRHSVSW